VDLEDEAAEGFLLGREETSRGLPFARRGSYPDEGLEEFPHTEVIEGAAEENRGDGSSKVVVGFEGKIDSVDKGGVFPKLGRFAPDLEV